LETVEVALLAAAIVEGEKNKLKEAQEKLEKISKQLEELK
jgi:hypothetical protein